MAFSRPHFLICFLVFFLKVTGQTPLQEEIVLLHDSLLNKDYRNLHFAELRGWKFSSNDDSAFSKMSFNDEDWYEVPGPLSEDKAIPDSLWNNFGWFRLKVKAHHGFPKFLILQNYVAADGAVEFYINDSLIFKKGNPSPYKEEQVLEPHRNFHRAYYELEPGKTYQLAAKYSFHGYSTAKMFANLRPPTDFGIQIFDRNIDSFLDKLKRFESYLFGTILAVLFMVMALHLYLHSKVKYSANFWVFLITGFIFLFLLSIVLESNLEFESYSLKLALVFSTSIFISLILGFLPLALHKILDIPVGKIWKYFTVVPFLLIVSFGIIQAFTRIPPIIDIATGIFLLVGVFIGGVMAIIKAKRKNTRDLYLIAGTFLGFPFFMLLGMILFNLFKITDFLPTAFIFASFLLVIPVGMSLYQGKNFLRLHTQLDLMVTERTSELERAMEDLRQSHKNLKAAQDQLVQQEKLASLGQLTAGIAHEIKNPLNFVTNFSDVCLELVEEAKAELNTAKKANISADGKNGEFSTLENLSEILETIEINLQKIFQHGNRADGVVRSMLLHSKGGSGKKVLTDLNHLVSEYVNLAFHGMRASRNPINVEIQLDLDPDIGEIPVITEDFSRVILNLCNNAFDAMREKKGDPQYKPVLTVSTLKEEDVVKISVNDNGGGIDPEILGNILEPFFTTKKGTDGTGLGLSLSHEIIKAHGGKIEIKSKFEKGATFVIILPLKNAKIKTDSELNPTLNE